MSRVGRRAGTKALTCQRRARVKQGSSPRAVLSFRGKSRARLDRHLKEVHGR